MKKYIKIALLLITLAIPVAIFMFLRTFGENKFNIPLFYENGVEQPIGNCSAGEGQFLVADSIVNSGRPTLILFFKEGYGLDQMTVNNHYQRLHDLYGDHMPEIIIYTTSINDGHPEYDVRRVSDEEFVTLMHCGLVTDKQNHYILVDAKGRIRGYYDTTLEEMDRLVVEIKILLENS